MGFIDQLRYGGFFSVNFVDIVCDNAPCTGGTCKSTPPLAYSCQCPDSCGGSTCQICGVVVNMDFETDGNVIPHGTYFEVNSKVRHFTIYPFIHILCLH